MRNTSVGVIGTLPPAPKEERSTVYMYVSYSWEVELVCTLYMVKGLSIVVTVDMNSREPWMGEVNTVIKEGVSTLVLVTYESIIQIYMY